MPLGFILPGLGCTQFMPLDCLTSPAFLVDQRHVVLAWKRMGNWQRFPRKTELTFDRLGTNLRPTS